MVLGPYGMSGVLTGQSFKDTDPSVQKVLNEWKQIYPLTPMYGSKDSTQASAQATGLSQHFGSDINSSDFGNNSSNAVNRVVEVIVSGFRMKYPFCYVFVTEIDEKKNNKSFSNKTNSKSVSDVNEVVTNDSFGHSKPILCPYQQQIPTHTYLLKNCVSHELSLSQQKSFDSSKMKELSEETADNLLLWSITDPCIKNNCNCFRCKAKKASNSSSKLSNANSFLNQLSANKKGEKTDKENRNKVSKSVPPFHRRSPVLNNSLELINGMTSANSSASNSGTTAINPSVSSSISQPTSVPTYSYKSPISGGGLPSLQSSAATPSGVNGVDSPHSVAQSFVMDGPNSSVERSNLSVSPHPTREDQNIANESHILSSNPESSPLSNSKTRLAQLLSPNNSLKANNINDDSPSGQTSELDSNNPQIPVSESNTTTVNSVPNETSNQTHQNGINGVKRPSLAICTYEDNDSDPMRNGLLYDYSYLNDLTDICDIPAPKNRRKNTFNDFRRLSVNDYYFCGRKRSPCSQSNGEFSDSQLMPKPKDPYEFSEYDEEGMSYKLSQNGINEDLTNESIVRLECNAPSPELIGNSNSQTNKDNQKTNSEMSATPPQMKNFTKEIELIPSLRDLDQIFDTSSGEDSTDETFQPPLTPSGVTNNRLIGSTNSSITGVNALEDHSKPNKNGSATNIQLASATLAELARMFPTPPSLEPMAPSPCGNFIGPDATIIDDLSLYPCSPNMIENSKVLFESNILK